MTGLFSSENRQKLRQFRLSSSQLAVIAVTSLFAVLAAFLKVAIGLAHHNGWAWVDFFQDVVQFAFIAAIVAGASAVIARWDVEHYHQALVTRTLRMMLIALHGPQADVFEISDHFTDADAAQMIREKSDSLAEVAKYFNDFAQKLEDFAEESARHTPSPDDNLYTQQIEQGFATMYAALAPILAALWRALRQSITASYDQDGLRHQRSIILSHIIADLAQISSTSGASLADEAIIARDRAVQYLALVARTDAAIESWLVQGNLMLSPGAKATDSLSAMLSTYSVDLDILSCTSDRLGYLVAYCDKVLGSNPQTEEVIALLPLKALFWTVSVEVAEASRLAGEFGDLATRAIAAKGKGLARPSSS
jgi:hypothetical protein